MSTSWSVDEASAATTSRELPSMRIVLKRTPVTALTSGISARSAVSAGLKPLKLAVDST
jgi:hypothetical protein